MYKLRNFFGFFLIKKGYFINLVVSVVVGYYAYLMIEKVPKPGTIPELLKHLFNFTGGYFWTILLCLIAFISVATLGITTVINSVLMYRTEGFFRESEYYYDYELSFLGKVISVLLIVIGLALFLWSFYYFSYAAKLLFVLIVLGVVVIFYASSNSSRSRR